MNRALLNPFEVCDLPETIEEYLEQDKATCMRFNRHGNLLAVGTTTGRVVVWDFDTKSVAIFLGEGQKDSKLYVTSVSFPSPQTGSTILASYYPGMVRLFDTLSNSIITEVRFDFPIVQAEAHPKDPTLAVAVPKDNLPIVLNMRQGRYSVTAAAIRTISFQANEIRCPAAMNDSVDAGATSVQANASQTKLADRFPPGKLRQLPVLPPQSDFLVASLLFKEGEIEDSDILENQNGRRRSGYVVRFTRKGDQILRGGPQGLIRTFAVEPQRDDNRGRKLQCLTTLEVPGKASIKDLIFNRKHNRLLVVSLDRCMRLFDSASLLAVQQVPGGNTKVLDPIAIFTEVVNKLQCQCACFSRDGDFVLGGMQGTDHRIHVWRAADGQLEKTLEGPKEAIGQILCHPLRPVIASLGGSYGGIYVWEKNFTENWSAFAPDFVELEANEEYVEREDEFDSKDSEDESKKKEEQDRAEQELIVDVVTCDNTGWFTSDSEGEESYFYIPATPVPDSNVRFSTLMNGPEFEKSEVFRNRQLASQLANGMPNGRSGGNRKRGRNGVGKKAGAKRRNNERPRGRGRPAKHVQNNVDGSASHPPGATPASVPIPPGQSAGNKSMSENERANGGNMNVADPTPQTEVREAVNMEKVSVGKGDKNAVQENVGGAARTQAQPPVRHDSVDTDTHMECVEKTG